MFLTVSDLKRFGACKEGIKFMERFYPDGAELETIIRTKHIPKDFLYWGEAHLPYNDTEYAAYCAVLHNENNKTVFNVSDTSDSSFVSQSSEVSNSTAVRNSSSVSDSNYISHSVRVRNSSYVYNTTLAANCHIILNSNMVFNSTYVNDSTNVVDSNDIVRCADIANSANLIQCSHMDGCVGCTFSNNLKNGLFCSGINSGENLLFNKPVNETALTIIKEELKSVLPHFHIIDHLEETPQEFAVSSGHTSNWLLSWPAADRGLIDFIKKLPNFDSYIMFTITNDESWLMEE